jgi:hypothetical protein
MGIVGRGGIRHALARGTLGKDAARGERADCPRASEGQVLRLGIFAR